MSTCAYPCANPESTPPMDAVPYEAQFNAWSCGAACLVMVYRSLGIVAHQREVWQRIARMGHRGQPRGHTKQIAQEALGRGLAALIVQARDPWLAVSRCLAQSSQPVRIIVNHRMQEDSP